LAAIAIAVKLGDGSPALYRWPVVGCGGRPFTNYKVRRMVVNADDLKPVLEARRHGSGARDVLA
jgi:lipopolysaccharide/colanic/teichoic acid biosynthesis glycosyltransferase